MSQRRQQAACMSAQSLSCVGLFATPWTVAHQAPPSMEFSRQEYWSGLPFPPPGDLPDPRIEPTSPACIGRQILYHWVTWEAGGLRVFNPQNELLSRQNKPVSQMRQVHLREAKWLASNPSGLDSASDSLHPQIYFLLDALGIWETSISLLWVYFPQFWWLWV